MNISDKGSLQSDEEALLEQIETYLVENYKPVDDPASAEMHFTTEEIYTKIIKLFPNTDLFRPDVLAGWLHKAGFKFYEYGNLNFEWMMNKA